jgi:hypothetical protein
VKRLALAAVALAVVTAGCARHDLNLSPACPQIGEGPEDSEVSGSMTLMVQSVPDAALYPCVDRLRPGWRTEFVDAERARTTIALSSDRLGRNFLEVVLTPSCRPSDDAVELTVVQGEAGLVLYQDVEKQPAGQDDEGEYEGSWWYVFDGGCVEFMFDAEGPGIDNLDEDVREAFTFFRRATIDDWIESEIGVRP